MPESESELREFLETLKPKNDVPFSLVVNVLSGKEVIPVTQSKEDEKLLKDLKKAIIKAGKKASEDGLFSARPFKQLVLNIS